DTRTSTFKEDKEIVIKLLRDFIAPNEKLYDYLEDSKLTWLDDLPLVNTAILKFLNKLKETSAQDAKLPKLFKSPDDEEFAVKLLRKVYMNDEKPAGEILTKNPNLDNEPIAEIDTLLTKMAICEFLHLYSITIKVTINEYLDIAKEYNTQKSNIFI